MSKSTVGILKMRRHSDISKLTVAYCAFGLIMVLAQVAFSAESDPFCATTYKEVENSKSTALKAAMKIIRDQEFRNKSLGTHLEFLKSEQIMAQTETTTFGGDYEKKTGVITICEYADGKMTIAGILAPSPVTVEFQGDNCLKVSGGLTALISKDKLQFCHGAIPDVVLQARNKSEAGDKAKDIAKNPRNANGASTVQ